MGRVDSLEKILMLGKTESKQNGVGGGCWGGRGVRQRMRCLDGITDLIDEFEQTLGDSEGQGSLACCNSWGRKRSDIETEQQLSMHFPGGPVVKNLPASIGVRCSIPDIGRSHVPQLLTEPTCPKAPALKHEKPPQQDCTPQLQSSPHSLQLGKVLAQQRRPSAAKTKIKKEKTIM